MVFTVYTSEIGENTVTSLILSNLPRLQMTLESTQGVACGCKVLTCNLKCMVLSWSYRAV